MRWMIDLDGVVVNHVDALLHDINERYGTAYQVSDLTSWNTAEVFGADIHHWLWNVHFSDPLVQYALPPVDGAVDAITTLRLHGDEVFLVTDREDGLLEVTRRWLRRHGIGMVPLIFTSRMDYLRKIDLARSLGIDRVVEDSPQNLIEMSLLLPKHTVFYAVNYPYNLDINAMNVVRVGSLRTAVELYEERRLVTRT